MSARSEPKNEIHKYNAAATKHTQVIGHLKNFLSLMLVDTLKLFFTSYELIQWTLLVLLSQWEGLSLQIDKACKFPAQFYSREKKIILKFKKYSWTCIIYDRLYAWNIVIKVWRISVLPLKYMFKFIISKTMF